MPTTASCRWPLAGGPSPPSWLHGAYASREEHLKGALTPGKLANFVLLADDPHEAEPGKIKDIQVVRTVVGGRTVHLAGAKGIEPGDEA